MGFSDRLKHFIEKTRGGAGQWVVVRSFTDVKSIYWNERAQESVGGPPYEYVDTVVLASKHPAMDSSRPAASAGQNILPNVSVDTELERFFFTDAVTIKEDDEIFELDASGDTTPTVDYEGTGKGSKILARYKVKVADVRRVQNKGQKIYTLAIAKRNYTE